MYVAHVLSFFWFDVIYGVGVGVGLPMWIIKNFF